MLSITHLQSAVESLLVDSTPSLPPAARQRLVAFVVGVLLAGTVVLRRVATTQAHLTPIPPPRPATNDGCAARSTMPIWHRRLRCMGASCGGYSGACQQISDSP